MCSSLKSQVSGLTVIAWIALIVSVGDPPPSPLSTLAGNVKLGASAADSLDTSAWRIIPFISATDEDEQLFVCRSLADGDEVGLDSSFILTGAGRLAAVSTRGLPLVLLLFFNIFGRW